MVTCKESNWRASSARTTLGGSTAVGPFGHKTSFALVVPLLMCSSWPTLAPFVPATASQTS